MASLTDALDRSAHNHFIEMIKKKVLDLVFTGNGEDAARREIQNLLKSVNYPKFRNGTVSILQPNIRGQVHIYINLEFEEFNVHRLSFMVSQEALENNFAGIKVKENLPELSLSELLDEVFGKRDQR